MCTTYQILLLKFYTSQLIDHRFHIISSDLHSFVIYSGDVY